MSDAPGSRATKTINLSDSETKLLLSIMKNLKGDIPFDAEAVAAECSYKSAKTVRDVWNRLKKNKLGVTSATTTPGKGATPGKKRKGDDDGADDDEVGSPTPTKKAHTSKAKKEATVKEDGEGAV